MLRDRQGSPQCLAAGRTSSGLSAQNPIDSEQERPNPDNRAVDRGPVDRFPSETEQISPARSRSRLHRRSCPAAGSQRSGTVEAGAASVDFIGRSEQELDRSGLTGPISSEQSPSEQQQRGDPSLMRPGAQGLDPSDSRGDRSGESAIETRNQRSRPNTDDPIRGGEPAIETGNR
jgi:hypothetical protein